VLSNADAAPGNALLALLIAASVASMASACEEPVDLEELGRVLDVATTAWVVMDRDSFEVATQERREALACLDELVVPELAIRLHLHEALAWSLQRRSDLSQGAFEAILELQPSWQLPTEMAPERHRLRSDFARAQETARPSERRPLAPPGDGALLVDGLPARDVPVARPFVIQMLDRRGTVQRTHYFTPGSEASDGQDWFGYEGPGSDLAVAGPEQQRSAWLLAGGAGVALLAGGVYALAASQGQQIERGEGACEDLPAARRQVNQLVGASIGLGAVGAGLAVAGVVVRF
jgi:hypothetical protein